MKTATVQTRDYGNIPVFRRGCKMIPISGASTLAEFRENGSLIPPWILPRDLAFGLDWKDIMRQMLK